MVDANATAHSTLGARYDAGGGIRGRETEDPPVLFQLVEQICASIDDIPAQPSPDLQDQIRYAAPDSVTDLVESCKRAGKPRTEKQASEMLAALALTAIKSIPRTARVMVGRINDERVDVGERCAMASILGYLVQPHDLIPDDAPGHYGYLDDATLLQAGLVEYADMHLPAGTQRESQAQLAGSLIALAPQHLRPHIQLGVTSMSEVLQIVRTMGSETVEGILQMIVREPLVQPQSLTAPPGFHLKSARDYGGFFSRSGVYLEGSTLVLGGGVPSSLDGRLFIP
jgi:uncharacterized membrane protein YkvA (DUF1232 family)